MTVRVTESTSAHRSQSLWARIRATKGRATIRADSTSVSKAAR
ncbi:Uncharacterised protein [Amycolatopsis camponoti]|uniref:Uncharacterized protein n=1 Tax=Amycolatopsis camponoti TaxID=2606593 RepID=A0A6I8M3R9_9PSEU|nr:hypothetical protein [Amycolatopsis camponoti]VVJ24475.1 Uncharacterised protein [Amycolatopsis camponoti]